MLGIQQVMSSAMFKISNKFEASGRVNQFLTGIAQRLVRVSLVDNTLDKVRVSLQRTRKEIISDPGNKMRFDKLVKDRIISSGSRPEEILTHLLIPDHLRSHYHALQKGGGSCANDVANAKAALSSYFSTFPDTSPIRKAGEEMLKNKICFHKRFNEKLMREIRWNQLIKHVPSIEEMQSSLKTADNHLEAVSNRENVHEAAVNVRDILHQSELPKEVCNLLSELIKPLENTKKYKVCQQLIDRLLSPQLEPMHRLIKTCPTAEIAKASQKLNQHLVRLHPAACAVVWEALNARTRKDVERATGKLNTVLRDYRDYDELLDVAKKVADPQADPQAEQQLKLLLYKNSQSKNVLMMLEDVTAPEGSPGETREEVRRICKVDEAENVVAQAILKRDDIAEEEGRRQLSALRELLASPHLPTGGALVVAENLKIMRKKAVPKEVKVQLKLQLKRQLRNAINDSRELNDQVLAYLSAPDETVKTSLGNKLKDILKSHQFLPEAEHQLAKQLMIKDSDQEARQETWKKLESSATATREAITEVYALTHSLLEPLFHKGVPEMIRKDYPKIIEDRSGGIPEDPSSDLDNDSLVTMVLKVEEKRISLIQNSHPAIYDLMQKLEKIIVAEQALNQAVQVAKKPPREVAIAAEQVWSASRLSEIDSAKQELIKATDKWNKCLTQTLKELKGLPGDVLNKALSSKISTDLFRHFTLLTKLQSLRSGETANDGPDVGPRDKGAGETDDKREDYSGASPPASPRSARGNDGDSLTDDSGLLDANPNVDSLTRKPDNLHISYRSYGSVDDVTEDPPSRTYHVNTTFPEIITDGTKQREEEELHGNVRNEQETMHRHKEPGSHGNTPPSPPPLPESHSSGLIDSSVKKLPSSDLLADSLHSRSSSQTSIVSDDDSTSGKIDGRRGSELSDIISPVSNVHRSWKGPAGKTGDFFQANPGNHTQWGMSKVTDLLSERAKKSEAFNRFVLGNPYSQVNDDVSVIDDPQVVDLYNTITNLPDDEQRNVLYLLFTQYFLQPNVQPPAGLNVSPDTFTGFVRDEPRHESGLDASSERPGRYSL